MNLRILIQVAAEDHSDLTYLDLKSKTDILEHVLKQPVEFKVKKVWKLADDTPHLIEYEVRDKVNCGF